jgi:hypothetical protein
MSSEISRIGGGPVRSPEPDSGPDPSGLPDGTSLGDGKYVYQGKIVGIAELPDGTLRIGEWTKFAYQGGKVDPSDLPTPGGPRQELTWYAYNGGLVSGRPTASTFPTAKISTPISRVGLYGPGRERTGGPPRRPAPPGGPFDGKYVWNGRAVDLSDLPDGTVIRGNGGGRGP